MSINLMILAAFIWGPVVICFHKQLFRFILETFLILVTSGFLFWYGMGKAVREAVRGKS